MRKGIHYIILLSLVIIVQSCNLAPENISSQLFPNPPDTTNLLAFSSHINPEQIAKYLHLHISNSSRENFAVMLLDQKHQLIKLVNLFTGTLNQTSVHIREVVKVVLEQNASAVVLAHNHPSGDPTPSQSDINITQKIKDALALIDVRVLDHIIIGNGGRFESLAQQGKM